jgi:biopolymer transport protein ExbD
MGMSAGGGGAGNVKSDINVTPLVDVVLVLLIIFLVTMPVVMRTVTLEVPRKLQDNEIVEQTTSKSIIITYRPDGNVVLSEGPGSEDKRFSALEVAAKIRPLLESKSGEKVVFVDFCDGTPWQDVVSTMDRVRSLADDKDHNNIKVALKKREKKSDLAADPSRIDPCS